MPQRWVVGRHLHHCDVGPQQGAGFGNGHSVLNVQDWFGGIDPTGTDGFVGTDFKNAIHQVAIRGKKCGKGLDDLLWEFGHFGCGGEVGSGKRCVSEGFEREKRKALANTQVVGSHK